MCVAGARVEGGPERVLDRQMGTSRAASWRLGRVRLVDSLSGQPQHSTNLVVWAVLKEVQ